MSIYKVGAALVCIFFYTLLTKNINIRMLCGVLIFTLMFMGLVCAQPVYDLDNLYMIHYNGADTFPIQYGACAPLKKEDKQPGIVLLTDRLAHCTAYNDSECEEQASYPTMIEPGLTDLTELGKEFSKFAFMICTIEK